MKINSFIKNVFKSFIFRISALFLLTILLLSSAYYINSIKTQRDLFSKSFNTSTKNTLETIKIGIELGLSLENYEAITKIFDWVKQDSTIEFIVITESNEILASYPDELQESISHLKEVSKISTTADSLFVRNIGWESQFGNGDIFVGFSTNVLREFNNTTLMRMGILSALFIFAASILVILVLRGIVNPIKNLQAAAESIRGGNFESRVNETKGGIEIESVASTFNLMVDELTEYQIKMENDLSKAAEFVTNLLPAELSTPIKIDWLFKPSDKLGGDTLGYHFLDDDHIAIYLVDVSGHGVEAALYSVSVLNIIKEESLPNTNFYKPSNLLENLNDIFQIDKFDNKYFTIWYGVYNTKTNELTYSSGGHPPALLLNSDSSISELGEGNMFIGAFPGTEYPSSSLVLKEKEQLYIFSDGLIEFRKLNNKVFMFDEFKVLLSDFGKNDYNLPHLLAKLDSIKKSNQLTDDISVIRIRV